MLRSLTPAGCTQTGPFIKEVRTEGRGGGGGPKADIQIVREVAWISYCRSAPNADRGEGVQNTKISADVLYVRSQTGMERGQSCLRACKKGSRGGVFALALPFPPPLPLVK